MAETADYDKGATPTAHHASHENGGADEITVLGLSGLLADPQVAVDHAVTHQNGSFDEISVAGLSGLLADAQTPAAHKTSHQAGGADVVDADTLDTLHASAFSLTGHNHAGVYEPIIAAGTSPQYWRGDKTWQTLNQAAIAGLTTGDSPIFVTTKLSGLTDGYLPYHVADATGLANSPVYTDGTAVGIGLTNPGLTLANMALEGVGIIQSLRIGAQGSIRMTRANGTIGSRTNVLSGELLGQLAWDAYYDATHQTSMVDMLAYADEDITTGNKKGHFVLRLNDGVGLHEKVRITNEGYFGIGKTPTQILDVAGQIRTDVTLNTGAKTQARYFSMNINGTPVNVLTD